jgi:hypothetical protein
MDIQEIAFICLGIMLSIITFFLKKESVKVEKLVSKIRHIEVELAKNGVKDCERWRETQKLLEDRRSDVISLYNKIENLHEKIDRK